VITDVAETHHVKLGKIAQPLRVAVSGVSATPPIDDTVALVGKEKTIQRLERALGYIHNRNHENA
jgi:glutamyl-tRNA synthetase